MGAEMSSEEKYTQDTGYGLRSIKSLVPESIQESEEPMEISNDLNVSFGYQCNSYKNKNSVVNCEFEICPATDKGQSAIKLRSSSFSCLSGAALSANATLANTKICNGFIAKEILPSLDSPQSFRRLSSSPSLSRLDLFSSSSQSNLCGLGSLSSENELLENNMNLRQSESAPTRVQSSSFLSAMDVQMAGGAAGEDRVQAVCSEQNGWLFCGVYDGFNGRDAADFLAGTLYENIGYYLYLLECNIKQQKESNDSHDKSCLQNSSDGIIKSRLSLVINCSGVENKIESSMPVNLLEEFQSESFQLGVLDCLTSALSQAERDFLGMVEQEMEDRPDLVSIGSCVLTVLLHGRQLYVLNLGDSRAVLATSEKDNVQAIQLTESHTVDNPRESEKVLADHPDDPLPIFNGKVKGKLKVTRAFGVGYLKQKKLNDALMGILRVRNLLSPPYVYSQPYTMSRKLSEKDLFVVLGSDGLFDFFSNDEIVLLVHQFIHDHPTDDPAKYLIDQLVLRAAKKAGLSKEELMGIPAGVKRKYHDDVTVIVIILGNKQRTSKASIVKGACSS